jgi:hypothetical protein
MHRRRRRAAFNLINLAQNIVALCDVDWGYAGKSFDRLDTKSPTCKNVSISLIRNPFPANPPSSSIALRPRPAWRE